ncbi:MAG: CoA pyrophosphatase [Chloroflexi bacterium]|nr:CoA pyrophosphatase [Chloroflexota bacterium]
MAPRPRALHRSSRQPGQARQAAVLALMFPDNEQLSLVLMQRPEYPGVHSGQISLPGGRCEPGETYVQTALRETNEELGVPGEDVEILGELTSIYIPPSDFEVHPFVGFIDTKPQWIPEPTEVAKVIETPLENLLDSRLKRTTVINRHGFKIEAPYYNLQGYRVWGATAIILSELEGRLQAILDS